MFFTVTAVKFIQLLLLNILNTINKKTVELIKLFANVFGEAAQLEVVFPMKFDRKNYTQIRMYIFIIWYWKRVTTNIHPFKDTSF